ncbi:DUF1835 domain-containing protein [Mesonia ostreae]|uniref:DUF1835 domain-containing protein n=1 Tax=Mesonia ostreae TaxID=861110 RepID=A0ABU2KHV7_9FLAO|nr:DUF1835 domain-containing protein [Mesonia ostreae]MDT0294248.1 DUF1835 domain-containing protein [Mesonia ostreae]
MDKRETLHIINGDSALAPLKNLNLGGKIFVWREMLCDGPTYKYVNSFSFKEIRTKFLSDYYDIPLQEYENKFLAQFSIFEEQQFSEVYLWFEYDLFCHINMLAAIQFLAELKINVPICLICSGRFKGESKLKGLAELTPQEFKTAYENRVLLQEDDMQLAQDIWTLYNEKNPKRLVPYISKSSNFEYLSNCLRAHLKRFPNSETGLNVLEENLLHLIENNHITSINQWLGYGLQYQGYYGYGDIQMQKFIHKLSFFTTLEKHRLILNEKGKAVIEKSENFYREMKDDTVYGAAYKYDFLYDKESHKLLKL